MKKIILAALILTVFTEFAQAQSNVTVYGSIDAGVRWQNNVGTTPASADNSKVTLSSTGTYNSNRLGFKGVEDLGGGLNANFALESGFNSGTGAPSDSTRLFNRTAAVGLGGDWGTVTFGRQYTVALRTVSAYDPFNIKYTSIIPVSLYSPAAGIRFDNDVHYTGVFGPLTLRAEHAFGEQAGSQSNGSANALGLTYSSGPYSVGGAYTRRKMAANSANLGAVAANAASTFIPAGLFEDNTSWTVGGAYSTGPFRVAAGYADEKQNNGPLVDTHIKNRWFGGSYSITPTLSLTAALYQTLTTAPATVVSQTGFDGKKNLFIVGMTYALSKRTNFYAEVDTTKFSGSATGSATLGGTLTAPNRSGTAPFGQDRTTAVALGINHFF
jgi:predicted porin